MIKISNVEHTECKEQLLEKAEELCKDNKARLTKTRRRVLEIICDQPISIKAYDILDILAKEDKSAKPITVYRALDFLMEQNLVHKIESTNSFFACPCPDREIDSQLLICDTCGLVVALHVPDACSTLDTHAREIGFCPERKSIEVHGTCADCMKKSNDTKTK